MPSINAGTAVITLTDHLIQVLQTNLPARLAEFGAPMVADYRLFEPEQYVESPANTVSAMQLLNVDEVVCWCIPEGPSAYLRWESDSGKQAKSDLSTRIRVVVLAKQPDGHDLPIVRGRAPLWEEWNRRRAEYYKAAVLDVICEFGENVNACTQALPVANDAAPIAVDGVGEMAHAAVIFECRQDVLIRRSNWS